MDTLAKRYGWIYTDIADGMYWEEVYEMYEIACNLNTIEKNEDMKFNFILHAQTKDAQNSWVDLPIPYPDRNWNPPKQVEYDDLKKLSGRVAIKREKATPAQKKRMQELLKRMEEHKKEVKKVNDAYLYQQHYK